MTEQSSIKKRRGGAFGFRILVAVGAVIAIGVLAILVDSAAYYNKVHAGVSVSGIDLGGQTKDQATTSLSARVDKSRNSPITLRAGDKTWTVMPDETGTAMDVAGAAAAAMAVSRENNVFIDIATRFKLYFSGRDVPLTGAVDTARVAAVVTGIAKELDAAPVNAGLAIENGQIRVVEGQNGQAVDKGGLAEQLAALLVTMHSTTVDVPIVVQQPDVQAEDNRAAQLQAQTMISGPITVTNSDRDWTITPQQIVSYLGFRSEDQNGVSTLVPFIDVGKLQPVLDRIAPEVVKTPRDASFASDGTKAWVVPGQNGEELDATATAQAVTAASLKGSGRTVEVVVKTTEPALTTEEAESRGIKDKLASYTTKYVGSASRQVNVRMATKYVTNIFMAPGDVFNFDKQIGPRTPARGFTLAPGITGPNTLEDVLGGGICQVSTTMFNVVFLAGLDVLERWNHSIYIDHYPKGRDATVTAGGKNLRFKNDTGHYIWIRGTSDGITTSITIYGTDDGRKVTFSVGDFYNVQNRTTVTALDPALRQGTTSIIDKGQTGRQMKTTRVVTMPDGTVLHKDAWTSTWPMYPTQIAVGTKVPVTTSTTWSTTTTTVAGGG